MSQLLQSTDNPFGVSIPFVQHLGFGLESWSGGDSVLTCEVREELTNSFHVAHGGLVMTLLDVSMAVAARSLQPEMGVITIEMKTTFMRPSTGQLRGLGHVLHRTGSMIFAEGRVVDAAGAVCAHATGTFRYVARRAPAGLSTD